MDTEVVNQILQEQREINLTLSQQLAKLRLESRQLKIDMEKLEKRIKELETQNNARTGDL